MAQPEQHQSHGAPFSNLDFYNRAIEALLRKEPSRGHHDGFRVGGRIAATAQTKHGNWVLTDKYSYEATAYDVSLGSKVHAIEQKRLQRAGESVLYLQLKDEQRKSLGYYHAFWPQELRSGSDLYERLHANDTSHDPDFVFDPDAADLGIYQDEEIIDPFPPAQWAEGQPHIYRERGIGGTHIVQAVTEAHTDPYLAQIYTELSFR